MANDDIDFDIDDMDDLDFDDYDADPFSAVEDGRSPAVAFATGAMQGALTADTGRVAYRALKENALPKGYSNALDTVEEISDFSRDVVEQVGKELKPAKDAIQGAIRDNGERIDKYLPSWLAEKVKSLGGEEKEGSSSAQEDPDTLSVNASLSSIFDARRTQWETQKAEGDAMASEADRKLANAKFETDTRLGTETLSGIQRLVAYQDTVLFDYQRKSLELQHRQFFAARDLLTVMKSYAEMAEKRLEAIQQNTMLPDIQKSRMSEEYMFAAQQNLIGDVQTSFHDYVADATTKFRENILKSITGKAGEIRDGIVMGLDMSSQLADGQEQMADMGIDQNEMMGEMAGGTIASSVAGLMSRFLGDRLKTKSRNDLREELYQQIVQDRPVSRKQENVIRDHIAQAERENGNVSLESLRNTEWEDERDREDFLNVVGKSDGWRNGRQKKLDKSFTTLQDTDEVTGSRNAFLDTGERLQALYESRDTMLNEWSKGDISLTRLLEDRLGMDTSNFATERLQSLEAMLRSMMPSWTESYGLDNRLAKDGMQPIAFDLMTRRSIVDIIPGYLSRILQQVTSMATGQPAERVEFSTKREAFVTASQRDKDTFKRVFNGDSIKRRREEAHGIAEELTKTQGEINPELLDALTDRILAARDQGMSLSLDNLRENTGEEDELTVARVDALLDNESVNLGTHNQASIARTFRRMDNFSGEVNKALAASTALGERDSLSRLGLLGDDGKSIDKVIMRDILAGKDYRLDDARNADNVVRFNRDAQGTGTDHTALVHSLRDHLSDYDKPYKGLPVYVTGGRLDAEDASGPFSPEPTPSSPLNLGPVETKLDSLHNVTETGFTTLAALLTTIVDQTANPTVIQQSSEGEGNASRFQSRFGNAGVSLRDGIVGAAKTVRSGLGRYYSFLGNVTSRTVDVAASTAGRVTGAANALGRDIYVKGEPNVVLRARTLRSGGYFDQETGEPIRSLQDVSGPVVDSDGNVVLNQEDFNKGLEDARGRTIKTVFGRATGAVSSVYQFQSDLIGRAVALPGQAYQYAKDKVDDARNAYVVGEDSPRVLGTIMRNGGYFSANTGKPIYKFSEIDGDLVNSAGKVVLTEEDLRNGLVDRFGVNIDVSGPLGYITSLAKQGITKTAKLYGKYLTKTKDTVMNTGRWAADAFHSGLARFRGQLPKDMQFIQQLKQRLEEEGLSLDQFDDLETLKAKFPDLDWESAKQQSMEAVQTGLNKLRSFGQQAAQSVSMIDGSRKLLPVLLEQLSVQRAMYEMFSGEEWDRTGTMELEKNYADMLVRERSTASNDASVAEDSPQGPTEATQTLLKDYRSDLRTDTKDESVAPPRATEEPDDSKAEQRSNKLLDMLKSIAPAILGGITMLGSKIMSGFSGLGGLLSNALGARVAGSVAGSVADHALDGWGNEGRGRQPRPRGRTGLLGKLWNGVKGAGKLAVGAGAMLAKPAGWLLRGGAALLSTVSWPVVATVAAVGLTAYGAYKGYKYLDSKSAPDDTEALRWLRYGFDPSDSDIRRPLRLLEAKFIEDCTMSSGLSPTFKGDPKDYWHEFADQFGRNVDDPNEAMEWATWFTKRFSPVILTAITVSARLGTSLTDLMDLEPAKRIEYVKRTRITQEDVANGLNPYEYAASPFSDVIVTPRVEEIKRYEDKLIASWEEGKDVNSAYLKDLVKNVEKDAIKRGDVVPAEQDVAIKDESSWLSRLKDGSGLTAVSAMTSSAIGKAKSWMGDHLPEGAKSTLAAAGAIATAPITAVSKAADTVKGWFGFGDDDKAEVKETIVGSSMSQEEKRETEPDPVEWLRLMQYGVPEGRTRFALMVLRLESVCLATLKWQGDVPTLGISKVELWEMIGPSMERSLRSSGHRKLWMEWLNYRFLPVFFKNAAWAKLELPSGRLDDISAAMPKNLLEKYLNESHFLKGMNEEDIQPLDVAYSPMAFESLERSEENIMAYRRSLIELYSAEGRSQTVRPRTLKDDAVAATPPPMAAVTRFQPATASVESRARTTATAGQVAALEKGRVVASSPSSVTLETGDGNATYNGLASVDSKVKVGDEVEAGAWLGQGGDSIMITQSTHKGVEKDWDAIRKRVYRDKPELKDSVAAPEISRPRPTFTAAPVSDTSARDDQLIDALSKQHQEAQKTRGELIDAVTQVTKAVESLKGSWDSSQPVSPKPAVSKPTAGPEPTMSRSKTAPTTSTSMSKPTDRVFDYKY